MEIAARQIRAKQPEAAQTLKRAREIADKLPVVLDARGEPTDTKPALLSELAGVLAASGASEEARQVARNITKAARGDIAWKHIVAVQSERGETDAALQTAEHIRASSQKAEALKPVVAALVRRTTSPGGSALSMRSKQASGGSRPCSKSPRPRRKRANVEKSPRSRPGSGGRPKASQTGREAGISRPQHSAGSPGARRAR